MYKNKCVAHLRRTDVIGKSGITDGVSCFIYQQDIKVCLSEFCPKMVTNWNWFCAFRISRTIEF